MSEPTKKGLVPVLRFPEFRDAGEWRGYKLGKCLSRHPEYGINAPAVPYSDDLPTYIRITDISEDGRFLQDQKVSVAKDVTDDNYLNEGDIVLARTGASVGKAYKYREKDGSLVFAGFLIRIKADTKKLNSELLFHFLSTDQYWRWVNLTSARSGQPGINGNEYSLLPIPLPSTLNEQQKIADCLSSIDELVTAQTQKVEALKAHKKGLMQQLFPAEGETVPKLRFPEFRDAGDWEEKLFESVAKFSKGKGISKSDISPNGTQPCIRYGELYTYYSETIESVVSYTDISPDDLVLSKANDVVIPASGETQIDIATASCVLKSGIALGGDLNIIRSKMNGVFLSYYLNNAKKKDIAQLAQGISVVHLYSSQLKNLTLNIPKIPEQQKIANCLSSIDDLITTQTQKLAVLKAHKKGLMQQLFPSVDA